MHGFFLSVCNFVLPQHFLNSLLRLLVVLNLRVETPLVVGRFQTRVPYGPFSMCILLKYVTVKGTIGFFFSTLTLPVRNPC